MSVKPSTILTLVTQKSTLKRALKLALVVGLTLNVINQYDALLSLDFKSVHLLQFFVTLLVPFCVSIYSVVALKLEFRVGSVCEVATTLSCQYCHKKQILSIGSTILKCDCCESETPWNETQHT